MICGAAATGKTALAHAIATAGGFSHLSSDVVRKELAGLAPDEPAPAAQYSAEASLRTYAELGRRAAAAAAGAGGAIVDATFRRRADRDAFQAAYVGTEPLFVECLAPAAVVAERARRREREPGHTSDATVEIAIRQLAEFEPLDEVAPDLHVPVRTDRVLVDVVDEVEAALDARLARAR